MTAEQFAYWLQGFMEVGQPRELNHNQIQVIKDHLKLVFDKKTPDRDLHGTESIGVPNSTRPISPYISPNDWSINPKPYNPYQITCTNSEGYTIQANDPNKHFC